MSSSSEDSDAEDIIERSMRRRLSSIVVSPGASSSSRRGSGGVPTLRLPPAAQMSADVTPRALREAPPAVTPRTATAAASTAVATPRGGGRRGRQSPPSRRSPPLPVARRVVPGAGRRAAGGQPATPVRGAAPQGRQQRRTPSSSTAAASAQAAAVGSNVSVRSMMSSLWSSSDSDDEDGGGSGGSGDNGGGDNGGSGGGGGGGDGGGGGNRLAAVTPTPAAKKSGETSTAALYMVTAVADRRSRRAVARVVPLPLREQRDGHAAGGMPLPPCSVVHCGATHAAAIAGGRVFTWGNDDTASYGQLGSVAAPILVSALATPDEPQTPRRVLLAGQTAVDVACGLAHTVVVTADGAVQSFGRGGGRLGAGAAQKSSEAPITVALPDPGQRVRRVSCGAHHTLVLTQGGRLFGWGRGGDGQLGDGRGAAAATPTAVTMPRAEKTLAGGAVVVDIACGAAAVASLVAAVLAAAVLTENSPM
jgi:hypothetical protein